MQAQAWVVLAVVGAMFVALATTRAPAHLVVLGALAALLLGGLVPADRALAGLGNPGLVTVAALLVVAAGLRRTGVLAHLVQAALGRPRGVLAAQARLVIPVAAASSVMNNTPVVAMLLPTIGEWARQVGVPASQLLMPLSFGAILGGMCSLIGSSTNLVVDGLYREAGFPGLGIFELSRVGVPAALAGIGTILLLGRRLLPVAQAGATAYGDPREYLTELRVVPGGPVDGKTILQAGLRNLPDAYLFEIRRGTHTVAAVRPDEVLEGGDQLVLVGAVGTVVEAQRMPGLVPATEQVFHLEGPVAHRLFLEAVVSGSSPLLGRTIKEIRFRDRYAAAVLGISREGRRVAGKIGAIALQAGDGLLLEASPAFVDRYSNSRDFYLVSPIEGAGPPTRHRAAPALGILVVMVAAAAIGAMTMLQASLLAALAMVAVGACSDETAIQAVDVRLLLTIAGALGLAEALTATGAAAGVAGMVLGLGGGHPWVALGLVYLATALVSELVTNNAAAAVMFPVAIATAKGLGVSPTPFVVTLMISASASFLSPLGYQTNLMVYGAGHYRPADFLRLGGPVSLAVAATTLALVPRIWPF